MTGPHPWSCWVGKCMSRSTNIIINHNLAQWNPVKGTTLFNLSTTSFLFKHGPPILYHSHYTGPCHPTRKENDITIVSQLVKQTCAGYTCLYIINKHTCWETDQTHAWKVTKVIKIGLYQYMPGHMPTYQENVSCKMSPFPPKRCNGWKTENKSKTKRMKINVQGHVLSLVINIHRTMCMGTLK